MKEEERRRSQGTWNHIQRDIQVYANAKKIICMFYTYNRYELKYIHWGPVYTALSVLCPFFRGVFCSIPFGYETWLMPDSCFSINYVKFSSQSRK